MRLPQTSQPGRGESAEISARSREEPDLPFAEFQRSKESRVRRISCRWPVRYLRASVTWIEAARFTAVERMPAVSQVSTFPEGGFGKMHARQAVGRSAWGDDACGSVSTGVGRMFIVAA